MSIPILRPYQQASVYDIRIAFREHKNVLYTAPTGSGKTVLFSYIVQGAMAKGKRVLILAHRIELIDQISRSLTEFDVPHSYIAAGYAKSKFAQVKVASVQTLIRRLDSSWVPDLIIVDECQHCTSKNTLGKILAYYGQSKVLGVTATPVRLSGEGMSETFTALVLGPTVSELVDQGSLAPVTVYAPPTISTDALHIRGGDFANNELSALMDKPKITGDAIEHYHRLAKGLQAVVFCVSVEHARHVAAQFQDSGIQSAHVDGGMDRDLRNSIFRSYRNGEITALTSCELISEGVDVPGIHVGILLRPTASTGLYLQQVGRCLRTSPGKERAIILDHAGNTLRHGLPTEHRTWSLEGAQRSKRAAKAEPAISIRVCPSCFTAGRSGISTCAGCGFAFPVAAREVQEVEGELVEVKAREARQAQGSAHSLEALIELGRMRGYKNPAYWARSVLQGRRAKRRA